MSVDARVGARVFHYDTFMSKVTLMLYHLTNYSVIGFPVKYRYYVVIINLPCQMSHL